MINWYNNKIKMIITKIGHSCLIVEENGTKVLVDPGSYAFMENPAGIEQIKSIAAIFISHEHPDHCDLEKLPQILMTNDYPNIYTNEAVAQLLKSNGIKSEILPAGDTVTIKDIAVKAVDCPHGLLPEGVPTPDYIGFVFNETLFHPGDCINPKTEVKAKVLALPIVAPWTATRDAVAFAKKLKPAITFPIHDSILRVPDPMRMMVKRSFDFLKMDFRPMKAGEELEF